MNLINLWCFLILYLATIKFVLDTKNLFYFMCIITILTLVAITLYLYFIRKTLFITLSPISKPEKRVLELGSNYFIIAEINTCRMLYLYYYFLKKILCIKQQHFFKFKIILSFVKNYLYLLNILLNIWHL